MSICDVCKFVQINAGETGCSKRYYNSDTNGGYVEPGYMNYSTCLYDPILKPLFDSTEANDSLLSQLVLESSRNLKFKTEFKERAREKD